MEGKNSSTGARETSGGGGRPALGLALGGGGILGLAHVGVLEVLTSAGLVPDMITGTSIGALVAGCYSGGLAIEEMRRISLEFSWKKARKHKVIPTMAVYSSEPMKEFLAGILPTREFDELKIPAAMVATDLRTAQMVVMGGAYLDGVIGTDDDVAVMHEDMAECIRASCTVPVLFEPVELGGRILVDGFLTNNVPAGLVRRMGAGVVVAVDLQQRRAMYESPTNIFEYIMQSQMIYRYWAVKNRHIWADVVIRPSLADCGWDDTTKIGDIIAAGREAAIEKLPEIRKKMLAMGNTVAEDRPVIAAGKEQAAATQ